MTEEISIIGEFELQENINKFNHFRYLSGKEWAVVVAISFLFLFTNAFLFMALLVIEVIVEVTDAAIWGTLLLLLWVFLSFLGAKGVLAFRIDKLQKMRYKKEVMFLSFEKKVDGRIYNQYGYIKKRTKYMNVAESGQIISYPILNNLFGANELTYGKVICRYSEEKISSTKDLNVFIVD